MSVVALFSTKEELQFLMKRSDFKKLKIVALTPEADFWARQSSLCYTTIEDYYDEASLNIVGVESHSIVENICHEIDRLVVTKDQKLTAQDFFYFIKVIYDQVLINHNFCKGLSENEVPNKVILLNVKKLRKEIYISDNDDLLLNTILYYFNIKKINCEIIFTQEKDIETKKIRTILPKLNYPKFREIISNIKFIVLSLLYNSACSPKKPKIFIAQHWDFSTCVSLKKYYKTYWLRNMFFFPKEKSISIYEKNLKKIEPLVEILKIDDISYYELLTPKISCIIYLILEVMGHYVEKIYFFLKKKNIKAVIAASGQSIEILASVRAAKILGIPVIWGQHGGLYGYAEFPIGKYLSEAYSHYLLYTKATSKMDLTKLAYPVSDRKLLDIYYENRFKN